MPRQITPEDCRQIRNRPDGRFFITFSLHDHDGVTIGLLEHVPHQINAYYTDKNFILLFPDSYAPASPELTFVELHGTRGTYEKKKGWLDFLWKKEEQN